MRDRRGRTKEDGWVGGNTGEREATHCERDERKRQTLRGKPTWPPASRMSAVSRLVAIHSPSLLKYYAHWLTLTAWPEGGDCVGKCVCLHLGLAGSKIPFLLPKSCKQHDFGFLGGFLGRCLWVALLKSTERNETIGVLPCPTKAMTFFLRKSICRHVVPINHSGSSSC